jgi:MFS family permease
MSAPVPAPTPPLATALAASGPAALPSGRKMVLLWTLYFVEGLPWGIQIVALPAILTEYGLSLTKIGFATALGLPWMLKIAWAPLVDRYGSRRFGRRRSWIVPLQLALAAAAVAAAALPLDRALAPFLLVLLAMNAIAATLDIAVDGLAVDLLELGELGRGNVAQVVGYKLGMLAGGGVLVWASAWVGWNGLFLLMALAILVAVALTLRLAPRDGADSVHDRNPPPTLGGILRVLGRSLASRRAAWLLLFVGTYKFG